MAIAVSAGTTVKCSFGAAPTPLSVLPIMRPLAPTPAANIMDNKPFLNIVPFGMCTSPANPQVIAATAAALGVFTPMPCMPVIVTPWLPGSPTVLVGNLPALNNASTCACSWGGVVSVVLPNSFQTIVP
ncbi:MAG: DUF4280 domain-containing protein [Myxococcota bacterium]